MRQSNNNHRISLLKAVLISLFIHALAAFWLDGRLVTMPKSNEAPLLSNSLQLLKEREAKNAGLKQAFKTVELDKTRKPGSPVTEQTIAKFTYRPDIKDNLPTLSLQITSPFPVQRFPLPDVNLFTSFHIPRELPIFKEIAPSTQTSIPIDAKIQLEEPIIAAVKSIEPTFQVPELLIEGAALESSTFSKRSFELPALASLSEFTAMSRSDWFDAELIFLPIEHEEGAEFAVTLLASPEFQATRLSQDFIFLIDRANSIQKERLFATKQAISRTLKELNATDRFNIIAFDSKVEKLFPIAMESTEKNLQSAYEFLNSIELGSFFSPSDLYRPLLFALPNQVDENRLVHCILLTDGEALSKKAIQKALLQDWTQRNQSSASLYAIGLESDGNAQTLDAICSLNRGKFLSAPTHRGIRKKLLKLIKMVEKPIANEISVTAINKRTGKSIPLSKQNKMTLFQGQPAVFLGSIEKLDDFILFVQAKIDGKWVHVKKNLSFLHAKRGGRSLRTEIALQKAYTAYLQYSEDNDPSHLAEARSILEPFDLIPAFQ